MCVEKQSHSFCYVSTRMVERHPQRETNFSCALALIFTMGLCRTIHVKKEVHVSWTWTRATANTHVQRCLRDASVSATRLVFLNIKNADDTRHMTFSDFLLHSTILGKHIPMLHCSVLSDAMQNWILLVIRREMDVWRGGEVYTVRPLRFLRLLVFEPIRLQERKGQKQLFTGLLQNSDVSVSV